VKQSHSGRERSVSLIPPLCGYERDVDTPPSPKPGRGVQRVDAGMDEKWWPWWLKTCYGLADGYILRLTARRQCR
jgi:hypothetical protein